MKALIVFLIFVIAGCTSNRLQSGEHKVVSVKKFKGKSVVQIEGSKKEFILPTDTLDKDEKVYIMVVPKTDY